MTESPKQQRLQNLRDCCAWLHKRICPLVEHTACVIWMDCQLVQPPADGISRQQIKEYRLYRERPSDIQQFPVWGEAWSSSTSNFSLCPEPGILISNSLAANTLLLGQTAVSVGKVAACGLSSGHFRCQFYRSSYARYNSGNYSW